MAARLRAGAGSLPVHASPRKAQHVGHARCLLAPGGHLLVLGAARQQLDIVAAGAGPAHRGPAGRNAVAVSAARRDRTARRPRGRAGGRLQAADPGIPRRGRRQRAVRGHPEGLEQEARRGRADPRRVRDPHRRVSNVSGRGDGGGGGPRGGQVDRRRVRVRTRVAPGKRAGRARYRCPAGHPARHPGAVSIRAECRSQIPVSGCGCSAVPDGRERDAGSFMRSSSATTTRIYVAPRG